MDPPLNSDLGEQMFQFHTQTTHTNTQHSTQTTFLPLTAKPLKLLLINNTIINYANGNVCQFYFSMVIVTKLDPTLLHGYRNVGGTIL
jgi:hypothetical protein